MPLWDGVAKLSAPPPTQYTNTLGRQHDAAPMPTPSVTLLVANFSPEELANVETTRLRQAELDEYNSMHGVCYSYRVQQPLTIATSNPCTTHDLQSHDHAPTHAALLQGGRGVGPIQYLTHMR